MKATAASLTPRVYHELPELPYPDNALAPYLSSRTVGLHHRKHHGAYLERTNELIHGTELAHLTLEELVRHTAEVANGRNAVFRNAAQAWNHEFYWHCMRPAGGGAPGGELKRKIEEHFDDLRTFSRKFCQIATTHFGSGWVWLVLNDGRLELMPTHDADTPLAHGMRPLLTLDLWEHAYYLDYQNRRADYVGAYMEHLVNWDFAAQNLALAASSAAAPSPREE
jgi:Fe-Mn family superoxide dismutase